MWKSIKIKEKTKKMLDELKVHPRQSYDEVIRELIGRHGRSN
jgi:predicted CopG family antitoxin